MTREEAISWLKELIWHEGEDVPIYDTDVEAIKMGIKALEQEPKWIPVTERLPKTSGSYLVSYDSGYVAVVNYYELIPKWGSTTLERIIAWMPMPKPYNKESREEG